MSIIKQTTLSITYFILNSKIFAIVLISSNEYLFRMLLRVIWESATPLMKNAEISKEDSDPILNAIKTFEKHPSILKIQELSSSCRFSFENVSLEDVKKVTRELDISKASQLLDIPTKIIKQNADIFSEFFFVNINHSINNSTFPDQLKWADVKPVFKKNSRTVKENYRLVSILPNISKIYERCLYTQVYDYFDVIFSKNQCEFRNCCKLSTSHD